LGGGSVQHKTLTNKREQPHARTRNRDRGVRMVKDLAAIVTNTH